MLKYFRVPLLFLFVGSLLGVFLRWQFISPTTGTNYSFFLHGHSHVMFLGWIFNVLYIAFCHNHVSITQQSTLRKLFIALQMLVVAMLISFPMQGYGFYSILFSTLHTFGALAFVILFFRKTRGNNLLSAWLARVALLLFALSTAGPFALGYIIANHLGQSDWYFYAIYFYLHFQYNGFFIFGVLSLVFNQFERKGIPFDRLKAKRFGFITAMICLPTYLLSTLWSQPGMVFNWIGGISAVFQLLACYYLLPIVIQRSAIVNKFNKTSVILLCVSLIAFVIKLILQIVSAFPVVAQMAYELRPVVIAYLHLVMIGMVSVLLFVWYVESGLFQHRRLNKIVIVFLASFIGMELCLIASPWWSILLKYVHVSSYVSLLFFSGVLSFSFLLFYTSTFHEKLTKIRF